MYMYMYLVGGCFTILGFKILFTSAYIYFRGLLAYVLIQTCYKEFGWFISPIYTDETCYIRSHSRDCFHDMKHGILCMNDQDKCNIINILQIINNNGCSSSTSWMILHEFPPLSIFNQLRIPFECMHHILH